jgi:hypothetical protein
MFTEYPTYPTYRTLKLMTPRMSGEDVYALQTAMKEFGSFAGDTDGILGPLTADAIKGTQARLTLAVDGLCGNNTQTGLVRNLTEKLRADFNLPRGLLFSQCLHESSCRVGNYSPLHGSTYDAGVAQRNTEFTKPEDGFNVPLSIDALGANLRKFYDKFEGVRDEARRWELASGSWNAPAYACFIANEEGARVSRRECAKPSDNARVALEQYMASATAYLNL